MVAVIREGCSIQSGLSARSLRSGDESPSRKGEEMSDKFWEWILWVSVAAVGDAVVRHFAPMYPHLYLNALAFVIVLNIGKHLGRIDK